MPVALTKGDEVATLGHKWGTMNIVPRGGGHNHDGACDRVNASPPHLFFHTD